MPEAINGQAQGEAPQLTEMLRNKRRQPVDRKGHALPIRKSGYDALDKNSFLKLLVTQLSKQDPTNPMNDREFISQMAQFSSLEQMNNVANSMNKLRSSQANQLIGKMIEGKDFVTEKPIQGIVTTALYQPNGEVLLKVDGRFTKLDDVTSVTEVTPAAPPVQYAQPQNVSRETLPSGVTLSPSKGAETNSTPAMVRQAHHDAITATQAAQAYEANQKVQNVSRETPAAPHKQKTKIEVPKGE
jgi:flagellar basal-body rod modification protein FlgD